MANGDMELEACSVPDRKSTAAFVTMDKDQTHHFESVKTAILKRYNINEETYRQRFRAAREELQESFLELEVRLRDREL